MSTVAISLVLTAEPFPKFVNIVPSFVRRRIAHRPNLVKIIDNIGWLFFDKVLRMGLGLLVGVWIARYLGPEKFGLLSFATALVGLFGPIAGLGLQSVVVRDIVRDPSKKEETLGTAALMQFIGGLLAYGLILGTIFWMRPDEALTKALVAILGAMLILKASEIAVYWFESQVLSKYIVWVQNGNFLIFALIKITLILTNAPLITFAWATMVEALSAALFLLVMLNMQGPRLLQLRVSLERAQNLYADSWPLLLSGVAIVIYMKIDQLMLGEMVGNDAVGIYSAALRISEAWYFIPMIIASSVFPSILEAKKRSDLEYRQRLQHLFDLMTWLSIIVAFPMTFLATSFVSILYGNIYVESGIVLAIHIWTSLFVFFGVASSNWFLIENLQKLVLIRAVLGAAINMGLNFLLIPHFYTIGAAVATLITAIFVNLIIDIGDSKTRGLFYMKLKSLNLLRIFSFYGSRI